MQEILIIIDEQGGVIVETDEGEQQFAVAAEALSYIGSLLPGASQEQAAPAAPQGEQAMWDEEAAARPAM